MKLAMLIGVADDFRQGSYYGVFFARGFTLTMSITPRDSLPVERDFDPWNGDLDAQCAWKNFGGVTLDEAEARFRENPLYYQEDFMFMGGVAFAYYFPVVENYLRGVPDADNYDDHQSWILAKCIEAQFDDKNLAFVRHLAPRVTDLADFVLVNIRRFGGDDRERQRVADAWRELVREVTRVMQS